MPGSSHCCDCLAPAEVVPRRGGGRGDVAASKQRRSRQRRVKTEAVEQKGCGAFRVGGVGGGGETGKGKRSSSALVATAECVLNKSVCVFFFCLQSGRWRERQDVKKSAVSESGEAELHM